MGFCQAVASGPSYLLFNFSSTRWALARKLLLFRPCLCEYSLNKPSPACLCNVPVNSCFIRTRRGFLWCVLARADEHRRPLLSLCFALSSSCPLLHLCLGEGFLEPLGGELIVTDIGNSQILPSAAAEPYWLSGDGHGKKPGENVAGPWFIGLGL